MKSKLILIAVVLIMLLCACNSRQAPTPSDPLDAIRTAAAATVVAMTTQVMQTQMAQPSMNTPNPTPVLTLPPVATPVGNSVAQTEVATSVVEKDDGTPCNRAEFVDETVPDGTKYPANTKFEKTWTLKNVGSCAWTSAYAAVFVKGDSMSGPAAQALATEKVDPGQTLTIGVNFTTPSTAGTYRAEYKLRDANGVLFAFNNPDATFWAEVEVAGAAVTAAPVAPQPFSSLDVGYCSAQWSSGLGNLPCPGKAGDLAGFVFSDSTPMLENGVEDDELGLWLGVQDVKDGYIKGVYPEVTIGSAVQFSAVLSCDRAQSACDARVSFGYLEGGSEQWLDSWHEVNDGAFNRVNVDLSALAGRSVRLMLKVDALGDPRGDMILIMAPKLK